MLAFTSCFPVYLSAQAIVQIFGRFKMVPFPFTSQQYYQFSRFILQYNKMHHIQSIYLKINQKFWFYQTSQRRRANTRNVRFLNLFTVVTQPLSTCLIKPKFLLWSLPPTQHHIFFRNSKAIKINQPCNIQVIFCYSNNNVYFFHFYNWYKAKNRSNEH